MHTLTELFPNAEISNAVHEYCITNSTSAPPHFEEHRQATVDYCLKEGENANMMIGALQAQFLIFWARSHGAKKILEIGMFTGYSALAWVEAVKDDPEGKVVCLDLAGKTTDFARQTFAKYGASKVQVIEGSAHTSIDTLAGQQFDIIFIDADKSGYITYFEKILALGLLSASGVIIADNALQRGLVADHSARNPALAKYGPLNYEVLDKFNRFVKDDPRVETLLLPAFDGLNFIRLKNKSQDIVPN